MDAFILKVSEQQNGRNDKPKEIYGVWAEGELAQKAFCKWLKDRSKNNYFFEGQKKLLEICLNLSVNENYKEVIELINTYSGEKSKESVSDKLTIIKVEIIPSTFEGSVFE